MAESDSGNEGIESIEQRHSLQLDVSQAADNRSDHPAIPDSTGLHEVACEKRGWMQQRVAGLDEGVEKFRADDAAEDGDEAQIPREVFAQALALGQIHVHDQATYHAQRDERTVSG